MEFIAEHADEMFRPGKATIFFRDCTAILVIWYLMRRTGIISLEYVIPAGLEMNRLDLKWFADPDVMIAVTSIIIAVRVLLYIWNYRVIYKYAGEQDNPSSGFYKVTPFIWMLEGATETASYLFWLLCVAGAIAMVGAWQADVLAGIIGVFTFIDIGYGNYWFYRQVIEKAYLPKK